MCARGSSRQTCSGTGSGLAKLYVAVLVGYHTAVAHLAACRGYGEDGTNGHARLRNSLSQVKVPHVTVVTHAVAYCLGRVDDGASADGNDEVDTLATAQVYAFMNF